LKKLSIITNELLRSVQFKGAFRAHIHGEIWATNIKEVLKQNQLLDRPIHVISANMHSVMNSIFATTLKPNLKKNQTLFMKS
jgi:hypothetical protein